MSEEVICRLRGSGPGTGASRPGVGDGDQTRQPDVARHHRMTEGDWFGANTDTRHIGLQVDADVDAMSSAQRSADEMPAGPVDRNDRGARRSYKLLIIGFMDRYRGIQIWTTYRIP